MKKFLCRTLLFALLLLALYPWVLCLLGSMGAARAGRFEVGGYDHLLSRMQEVRQVRDVDVLFLGSSHCYRTFDTRYYARHGLRTFNLGSSNQTPVQTEVLLHDYLGRLRPRLVVLEVHPDIMAHDGIESMVDMMVNAPITAASTRMALRSGNMKVVNSWLYGLYSNRLCSRFDQQHEDSVINGFAYVPGGFVEVGRKEFAVQEFDSVRIAVRPEQLAALRRCLALLAEQHIPYLLVEVQDAEQYRRAVVNHGWFEQQMESLGPYCYQVLPLTDTADFYDNNHLGPSGIERYNDFLYHACILPFFSSCAQ